MSDIVLVVDDDRLNRMMLSANLKKTGYIVLTAKDGQQALDVLENQPVDAVLLDLLMPGIDGYQVLARMKENSRLADIPVIIISVMDDMESIIQCIEMGATDYLPKPFNPVLLKTRLDASLAQRRLQDRSRELQARNEDLDAFSSTVAHDLKTPLTAMLGFAHLLLSYSSEMPPDQRLQTVGEIMQAGKRMENIINELLLLARLHKESVQTVTLDMGDIVAEVQERLAFMTSEYDTEIILPDSWPAAKGYGPWIEEVWSNYLSNGMKYGGTPPRLELGSDEMADGMVRFWVRDNGPGIKTEELETLFTPFTRLDQVRVEGQGLGLSIVERIMDKIGGGVGVASEPGQGSTFWFTLPKAQ